MHLHVLARATEDLTTFLAIAEVLPKDSVRKIVDEFVPLESRSSDHVFLSMEKSLREEQPLVRTGIKESDIVRAKESKIHEVHLAAQRLVRGGEERVVEDLFVESARRGEDERAAALLGSLLLQKSPFKSTPSFRKCSRKIDDCGWGGVAKISNFVAAKAVATRFRASAHTKIVASTVAERILGEQGRKKELP